MTSQLKVDRISPATGTEIIIDGLDIPEPTESPVKAWVNFNGTGTVAIRDSMNVSSITDDGTGIYTVNFTTAFPDTNYACVGSQSPATESHGSHSNVNVVVPDGLAKTTSAQKIDCRYVHGYSDPIVVSVVFIGN